MSNATRALLRGSLKNRGLLGNRRLAGRPRFREYRTLLAAEGLLWPAGPLKPDKTHPRHKRPLEER